MGGRSLSAALLLGLSLLGYVAGQSTTTTGPSFIGWYNAPTTIEAINCPSGEVHTTVTGNRPYGGCCKPGGNCPMATDCFGTTVLMNDGHSRLCTSGMYCMSFTVFDSFPDGTPSAYHLDCQTFWRAHTVYKTIEEVSARTTISVRTVTITATPDAGGTFSSASSQPTSSDDGSSDAIASPDVDNSDSGNSAANASSSLDDGTNGNGTSSNSATTSNAWIAGAVIGPVAAFALVGAALWYMRRRNSDQQNAAELAGGPGGAGGSGGYQPQPGSGGSGGMPPPMSQQAYMGHWNPKQTTSPTASYGSPIGAFGPTSPPQGYGQMAPPASRGYGADNMAPQQGYEVDSSSQGYGASSPPQGYATEVPSQAYGGNSPPPAQQIPGFPQRSWTGTTGFTELSAMRGEGRR